MHIKDDIKKETTLKDGSELKVTENSLIHIGEFDEENEMKVASSFMGKLAPSTDKDNALTDIALESIDAVRYSSQMKPQLTLPSIGVSSLGFLVSLYCWYQFGMNGFSLTWAFAGIIVLMVGALVGWFLREHIFVEEITVHLSSGETLEYIRNVGENPETAQLELLWVVQEIRQQAYN